MTQIAAIAESLIKGNVISIMTGFQDFGCTNIPREISRSIEKKFGVVVAKTPTEFTSRYDGRKGIYYKYRLPRIPLNAEGRKKMKEYVKANKQQF